MNPALLNLDPKILEEREERDIRRREENESLMQRPHVRARARRTIPARFGGMNKTEKAFFDGLLLQKKAGKILDVRYEALKFRLGKNLHYTPDFLVVEKDGHLTCWEIKGYWREDARVKIKSAAELYPWFAFRAVQRIKGKWVVENIW